MKREADGEMGSPHKRSRRGDDELRLLIPSKVAGSIIGKGGQNITKLRSQYKASITVPDCPGPERMLTLSSDLDTICNIVGDVVPNLEENGSIMIGGNDLEMRMMIHQSQAGAIIGKGGQKIKELRDKLGAKIKIFSKCAPQSADRVIQIIGEPVKCINTIREVIAMTKLNPYKGPVNYYDPHNYDDFFANEYGGYGGAGDSGGGGGERGGSRSGGGGGRGRNGPMGGGGGGGGGGGSRMSDRDGGGRSGGSRYGGGGRMSDRDGGGRSGGGGLSMSFERPLGGSGSSHGGGGDRHRNSFGGGGSGGSRSSGGLGGINGGGSFESRGGGGGGGSSSWGSNSGMNGGGGSSYGSFGGSGGGPPPMVDDGPNGGDGGNRNSTQVTIPKYLAGAIIGTGGGRIRKIRQDSRASITIDEPLPGSNDRIITISGLPSQIQMAQYLLQQSVHNNTDRLKGFVLY